VKKGISVGNWKEEHEGELMDIDPVSISSVVRNLSPSCSLFNSKNKNSKKEKS